jgi:hypothetical protein
MTIAMVQMIRIMTLIEIHMSRSIWWKWGNRGMDHTLDRVMGIGVYTPKPTIPVPVVDAVP